MTVSYNTFERLKERGLAAFKNGDYKAANPERMREVDTMVKIDTETTCRARRSERGRRELAP